MSWRVTARFVGLCLVCVSVGLVAGVSLHPAAPTPTPAPVISIDQCTTQSLATIKSSTVDLDLLLALSNYCYERSHGDGLLNDFSIRRVKFVQQAYDERILLWMVVALTMGGVALAALQMLTSYRLSADGHLGSAEGATEFALEKGKIALKSSVTGLFVLVFSFAFFYVFVYEIYKIKDINPEGSVKTTEAAPLTPGLSPVEIASAPKK